MRDWASPPRLLSTLLVNVDRQFERTSFWYWHGASIRCVIRNSRFQQHTLIQGSENLVIWSYFCICDDSRFGATLMIGCTAVWQTNVVIVDTPMQSVLLRVGLWGCCCSNIHWIRVILLDYWGLQYLDVVYFRIISLWLAAWGRWLTYERRPWLCWYSMLQVHGKELTRVDSASWRAFWTSCQRYYTSTVEDYGRLSL